MELQDQLMELCAEKNRTVLMVTHDVDEAILLADRIVMMTNGPAATIGEILDVTLERPRDRLALAATPEYAGMRAQVLRFLYEKQRKVEHIGNATTEKKRMRPWKSVA
jgi:nitrate/nitrite transport system ATP-binding protein